ncbi:helix-turn-helix domain-containing protein [Flammeovirgaceae bacterium SG7u.111]|nr:helix-turn-helix domain-containing protein [Flammeovirgaceae bacterium SG7u.132]WPO36691.1 helix-turn-helix domain-containing protein [Flammeovirgaceae bacterium SG7u.111]
MTEKQANILKAALELFATEGFSAVATSKIAKRAGVSEGLIFKHFGNKEKLLAAVLDQGYEQAGKHLANVLLSTDPKEVIRKAIELPFMVDKEEKVFWRLTYSLKWQQDAYDESRMEPLKISLENAFKKLGYEQPELETELLLVYFDGVATKLLLHKEKDTSLLKDFILSRYKL